MKFPKVSINGQKIKKRKKIILMISLLVIIFGVIGLFIFHEMNSSPANDQPDSSKKSEYEICKNLVDVSKENLENKKYQDAYSQLSGKKTDCDRAFAASSSVSGVSLSEINATKLRYYGYIAVSAAQAGKNEEAKKYANKAISINKSLSSVDQQAVDDQNQLMADVFLISKGLYVTQIGGKKL